MNKCTLFGHKHGGLLPKEYILMLLDGLQCR